MKKLLLICLIAFSCPTVRSAEPVPIAPAAYQRMLGRGLDVDWSKTPNGRRTYSTRAVEELRDRGFSHVRIRVKEPAEAELLAVLQAQVDDCLRLGVIPVIAYQADAFKKSPTEENLLAVTEWWRRTAEHFCDYPPRLSFDLLIECTDALNREQRMLDRLFESAVAAIRASNPTRILFISPRVRSAPENLAELALPSMHNGFLMAEWHFYASGPSKSNPLKRWTDGNEQERKIIDDKIACALRWQRQTGIPTWVGAWMPGNYNDGDDYTVAEQTAFARYVVSALDQAGIPFAVNQGNKFYDYELRQWIPRMLPVVEALTGQTKDTVR